MARGVRSFQTEVGITRTKCFLGRLEGGKFPWSWVETGCKTRASSSAVGSWWAGSKAFVWHCSMKQSPPIWKQPQTRNLSPGSRGEPGLFSLCSREWWIDFSFREQRSLTATELFLAALNCWLRLVYSTWLFCKETCRQRLGFRAQETQAEERFLLRHTLPQPLWQARAPGFH